MISAYIVIGIVFGTVLCYEWLLYRFWLRDLFSKDNTGKVFSSR